MDDTVDTSLDVCTNLSSRWLGSCQRRTSEMFTFLPPVNEIGFKPGGPYYAVRSRYWLAGLITLCVPATGWLATLTWPAGWLAGWLVCDLDTMN